MFNSFIITTMNAVNIVAETAPHGEEAASGGLPQMDVSTFAGQLFWLALTFGILFVMMKNFIIPRLGGIIEERGDRIADDLDQAAEFKQQAEDAQTAYEDALSSARAKAQSIAGDQRSAIDEQIASMQATMETELGNKVSEAEKRINDMKENAQAKVRDAAVDTTKAIVEALIEEDTTTDAVNAALNSVLAR